MADTVLALERKFCPPIDSSLFNALILDYNLDDPAQVVILQELLGSLAEQADVESAADFDPSGTSGGPLQAEPCDDAIERSHSNEGSAAFSADSSLNDAPFSANSVDGDGLGYDGASDVDAGLPSEWRTLSPESQLQALGEIFPNLRVFDIQATLQKSDYDYNRAIEHLLNQAFLETEHDEDGTSLLKRGVDGFADKAHGRRKSKRRDKAYKASFVRSSLDDTSRASSPAGPSRWDKAREDIDYLSARTFLSSSTITSVYHQCSGSMLKTVEALCKQDRDKNPAVEDVSPKDLDGRAAVLQLTCPWFDEDTALALVKLAYPSSASAEELGNILAKRDTLPATIDLAKVAAPFDHDTWTTVPPRSYLQHQTLSSPARPLTAQALSSMRTTANLQAAAAHRQAKSRPLMGGAAAYYASEAHAASRKLRALQTAEAESLVASQSRQGHVDLHGVNVADALTITQREVRGWWSRDFGGAAAPSEGARQRSGKVMPGKELRVIVGKGQHSVGGKGKLGPAVAKMLVAHGWRVEVGDGWIDVVGRSAH